MPKPRTNFLQTPVPDRVWETVVQEDAPPLLVSKARCWVGMLWNVQDEHDCVKTRVLLKLRLTSRAVSDLESGNILKISHYVCQKLTFHLKAALALFSPILEVMPGDCCTTFPCFNFKSDPLGNTPMPLTMLFSTSGILLSAWRVLI